MKIRRSLILAIVWALGCGGQSEPTIPRIEPPAGEVLAQPIVIEIRAVEHDGLEALRIQHDSRTLAAESIRIDPLSRSVWLPSGVRKTLESGASIEGIELRGTQKLSEVGTVILIDWAYAGAARFGSRRQVLLTRELPETLPGPAKIDHLDLAPEDPSDRLFDVRPWPDSLRWHLDAEKHLIVETAGARHTLAPGESAKLEPAETRVDVSIAEYTVDANALPEVEEGGEPVDVDSSLLRLEKSALGSIVFRTQLSLRFQGSMALIVPTEATP